MMTPVTPPPPVYILGAPVHPVTYASFLDLAAGFIAAAALTKSARPTPNS